MRAEQTEGAWTVGKVRYLGRYIVISWTLTKLVWVGLEGGYQMKDTEVEAFFFLLSTLKLDSLSGYG